MALLHFSDRLINAESLWKRKLGTKEYGMNAN